MEKNKGKIIARTYDSPCGTLLLGSFDNRLCFCDWNIQRQRDPVVERLRRMLRAEFTEGTSPVIETAAHQLDAYFAGGLREFDVPLLFVGTDFQKTVWNALLAVPYGTTVSYADMARQIGRPTAVRAVANANGANAISIFAPCHRVIGSDHTLTGYGGGLAAKEVLLRREKAI